MPAETQNETPASAAARRRGGTVKSGRILSAKMDKTVVVAVERLTRHGEYKRVVRRTTKLYAHDERNACKVGDVVTIVESRPISRLKRWRVRSIVREGRPVLEAGSDAAPGEEIDTGRPRRRPKKAETEAEPGAEAPSP